MTTTDFQIKTLHEYPQFREIISDRIWNAWWRDEGWALEDIDAWMQLSLVPGPVPTTLVVTAGEKFLGTVSLIESDMDERPDYRPWIAALWVEPDHRRRGIGGELVRSAARIAFDAGVKEVYLATSPENERFYLGMGWRRIEEDVSGLNILSQAEAAVGYALSK